MTLRNKKHSEIEELRAFVDEMKRGCTPATGDSLLETLRQIHDKREAPQPSHDHRTMLLARLQREMAERTGEREADYRPVIALTPVRSNPVVRWAIAASLVLHVAVGAIVLPNLQFSSNLVASVLSPHEEQIDRSDVLMLPLAPVGLPPSVEGPLAPGGSTLGTSPRQHGTLRETELSGSGVAQPPAAERVAARVPTGPPVPADLGPMVGSLVSSGMAPEERGVLAEGQSGPAGPPSSTEPAPTLGRSDVMASSESREFDVEPHITFAPRPAYPVAALESGVRGTVLVSVEFDADGTIRNPRIVRGLGHGLDEAAIEAARKIRFVPATRNGVPVPVRMTVQVTFTLR